MSKYGSQEIYSRFLKEDWVKDGNKRVHSKAFQPYTNPTTMRQEVSCFETQNLIVTEIYQLSVDNHILPNGKSPFGHCSIMENEFLWQSLSIEKNYIPERHVDIIGWERYSNKEDMKDLALKLAEISSNDIVIY